MNGDNPEFTSEDRDADYLLSLVWREETAPSSQKILYEETP